MANTVAVNFMLDSDIIKNIETVCEENGLSMKEVFTIFANKVAKERRIPFDLDLNGDPFSSENNIAYLEKKMSDYKAGRLRFEKHDLIED